MHHIYRNTFTRHHGLVTGKLWGALLAVLLCLSSCASEDFFQEDARATEAELQGLAPAGKDSVWVVAGRHYDRSGFHRFFWGDHYRTVWSTPVKLPVFRPDSIHGGLSVVEKGGGFQTTSFTLQDSAGRVYAFRSLDKDPVDVVTPFWQKTFVANILRDQTSATNPYGALVVPALAEAVGVLHTNPELYYVSSTDTSFGIYTDQVQGKLFMLEEKFKSAADLSPAFGPASGFANSDDALKNRFGTNTHHFNQEAFARARLLDMLIGDWDRHKGQWDWSVQKQHADTYYTPIPKDRDQVFLEMGDGLIPAIATSKIAVRKFHSFDNDFKDVRAYMINAEFVDERMLNELSLETWQRIARDMQASLTDDVILKAVRRLPPPIYNLIGDDLVLNLKSRRELLLKAAVTAYKTLAEDVTIAGSDAEEHFLVRRLDKERTEVKVTRTATDTIPEKQLYHRIFYRKETDQITLHGLAGDDTFLVEGNVDHGILVRIYGGLGEDTIADSSAVSGWKKLTRVYDTERGNKFFFGPETKDMTTRDVRVHAFDREGN